MTKSSDFFSKINYSAANEDGRSELLALNLKPSDAVLCVTGSGARPLDLLLGDPRLVVAIDFNATQNHLLELKMSAYLNLSYQEFLFFLGIESSDSKSGRAESERWEIFLRNLVRTMSEDARVFWRGSREAIETGVIYCGTWELYMRRLAAAAFPRKKTLERLFMAQTLEEQYEIWSREWDGFLWRLTLRSFAQRWVWRWVLREPGISFVSRDFSIFEYLHQRFDHCARSILFRDAPYLWLMLRGYYSAQALPLHLQKESFEVIRDRLGRIKIETKPLGGYLQDVRNQGSFDAFSVSDFSSYATITQHKEIWQGILKAGKTGARICERQFLVKFDPGEEIKSKILRDKSIETRLLLADDSFIYTFVCATIKGALNDAR